MRFITILILLAINIALQARFITIQLRTASIYHRYYLIKRLEQSCMLLSRLSVQRSILFQALDSSIYTSEDIKTAIEQMKSEKSVHAFFDLWKDFCAYKNMYNESFKNELIELIYMLYSIICPIRKQRPIHTLEDRLFAIDRACDLHSSNGRSVLNEPLQELEGVTTDLIAKRFYILKRLHKSMEFLENLHAENFQFESLFQHRNETYGTLQELENFQHDRVRESVMQMYQAKNIEPLLRLCNEAKQYRFAQDENFLQEMLMNIFLVYKTILLKSGSSYADPAIIQEINHVLHIYENLSTMPLDQTLEAIDAVTDRLIAIQAERTSRPYVQWGISGAVCALVCSAAYYYFVHQR